MTTPPMPVIHEGIALGFAREELMQSLDDRIVKLGLDKPAGKSS